MSVARYAREQEHSDLTVYSHKTVMLQYKHAKDSTFVTKKKPAYEPDNEHLILFPD
jgi:hypothetical protein